MNLDNILKSIDGKRMISVWNRWEGGRGGERQSSVTELISHNKVIDEATKFNIVLHVLHVLYFIESHSKTVRLCVGKALSYRFQK